MVVCLGGGKRGGHLKSRPFQSAAWGLEQDLKRKIHSVFNERTTHAREIMETLFNNFPKLELFQLKHVSPFEQLG